MKSLTWKEAKLILSSSPSYFTVNGQLHTEIKVTEVGLVLGAHSPEDCAFIWKSDIKEIKGDGSSLTIKTLSSGKYTFKVLPICV